MEGEVGGGKDRGEREEENERTIITQSNYMYNIYTFNRTNPSLTHTITYFNTLPSQYTIHDIVQV